LHHNESSCSCHSVIKAIWAGSLCHVMPHNWRFVKGLTGPLILEGLGPGGPRVLLYMSGSPRKTSLHFGPFCLVMLSNPNRSIKIHLFSLGFLYFPIFFKLLRPSLTQVPIGFALELSYLPGPAVRVSRLIFDYYRPSSETSTALFLPKLVLPHVLTRQVLVSCWYCIPSCLDL